MNKKMIAYGLGLLGMIVIVAGASRLGKAQRKWGNQTDADPGVGSDAGSKRIQAVRKTGGGSYFDVCF